MPEAGGGNSIVFISRINEDYEARARAGRLHRREFMGRPIRFRSALAAILFVSGALAPQGRAQRSPSHCSADGSPRDDAGRPHCCKDGSIPEGVNQCWCEPIIVHLREYRNPMREYEVRVPDGIAEILGCSGIGIGFKIALTHPDTGEQGGDSPWNTIWVTGAEQTRSPFQRIVDGWKKDLQDELDQGLITDVQIDPPEQTTLSSLTALHLKKAWNDRDQGKLIAEAVIADHLDKDTVYEIGMISPAEQYEKNHKLFKELVDGFRYIPSGDSVSQ